MNKWQDSALALTSSRSSADSKETVTLSWKDVNVYVKQKQRICCKRRDPVAPTTHVLKSVYGHIKPGSLLAVMGASGSGKTTLLNVLTSRIDSKSLSTYGDVRVNGVNIGANITNVSAYVRQDDMFIATMTVKEHLTFRAMLRMDKAMSTEKRKDRVEEVIRELGLQKCKDSMIGDPGRIKGISGGEMRRLSFASEILNNPLLLFCDEPTSGLDAFMAESIVQSLKAMTDKGKTVLCTIHQPSSEVFTLFSHILIMAEGRVAFLGTLQEALEFYRSVGYPCPVNFNPADFYIMKMAVVPGHETECRQEINGICDKFTESDIGRVLLNEINTLSDESPSNNEINGRDNHTNRFEAPWYQQFSAVFARSLKTNLREPVVVRVRLAQTIILALVLGLIYLQLKLDQEGVMNINGVLFLMLTNITISNMLGVLNSFPFETPIFYREYGIGLYRVDMYFICKCLAELPFFVIIPIIFAAITYWMVGLYGSAEAFLICTSVIILVANISVSFGYIVSAAVNSVSTALAVAPPIIVPLIMFGGFFLNSDSIPVYFLWLEYLSWFKFANELLSVNQWENVDMLECDGNSTSPVDSCHYHNGHQVILYLNYDKENMWLNFGLLFAMLIGYRLIAFIVLLIRARRSKR